MALDGLVIYALTEELQKLVGGRITKIHQPSDHDIVMLIRSQKENYRLLMSANPTYPRVHLSKQSYINPLEAPMFCMLMRKHCENGIIQSIRQIGAERMIHMDITSRNEIGDLSRKTIIMELTGRHSNIILLDPDTEMILDGIHHVTPAISSHRVVLPGSQYVPPPDQGKLNPFTASREQLEEALIDDDAAEKMTGEAVANTLVARFSGISPLIARELVHRSPSAAAEALLRLIADLRAGNAQPTIVIPPSGRSAFSITPLTHLQGETTAYATVSDCLEAFYGDKAERDTIKQRVHDLLRLLQNERNKNVSKLKKLMSTLEEAQDADKHRIMGELLTASLHLVSKGDTSIEVINYYDEHQSTITIALDPQLTPSENAQRYFKKYTKMKNSIIAMEEQIRATEEEIRYLDEVLQQLSTASLADIEEIRDELIEQGYVRRRSKAPKRKKKNERPTLTCYISSEGVPIYVGKNNTQNDYLTSRLASPHDTWLHTKDIPGSHVVIRGEFGDETLHEAGMLAAYFSQARTSSQVPVDYTLIRHVRKPNGAKPGFVIYERQKTLYITPDEQRIKSLKQEPRK